jgi:signal-transduction protein with cAMP-binding, CBS, and nucleotidyltransferase domain
LNNRTFSEELNLLKDNGMSMALRQQIAIYLFKDYLQKIPFFQSATDSILGMICLQLHQVIYMPDDYIIKEGEVGKELFMIVKGIVRVMPPKEQQYQTERIQ